MTPWICAHLRPESSLLRNARPTDALFQHATWVWLRMAHTHIGTSLPDPIPAINGQICSRWWIQLRCSRPRLVALTTCRSREITCCVLQVGMFFASRAWPRTRWWATNGQPIYGTLCSQVSAHRSVFNIGNSSQKIGNAGGEILPGPFHVLKLKMIFYFCFPCWHWPWWTYVYIYCTDVVSWNPCPERAACGQVQLNSPGAKGNCLAMGLSSRKHRPCVEVNIIPTACLDGMNIRIQYFAAAQKLRSGSNPSPTHAPDLRCRPFEMIWPRPLEWYTVLVSWCLVQRWLHVLGVRALQLFILPSCRATNYCKATLPGPAAKQ